jgi:hypothetical protein
MAILKSITIHGLDDYLDGKIKEKAESEGISFNKAIKKVLEEAFGINKKGNDNKDQFMDLFGAWTIGEQAEFEKAVADLEKVNPEDWR